MERKASAARSGGAGMPERLENNRPAGPEVAGGDIDADWQSAAMVGDEAPGGDNPTPAQQVVDDVGRAVGLEYRDSEELKSTEKMTEHDRRRWELDPASSEDYKERTRKGGKVMP
ncbi:MAG: DUF6335 family protein [Vicinamibacterales bacterium]